MIKSTLPVIVVLIVFLYSCANSCNESKKEKIPNEISSNTPQINSPTVTKFEVWFDTRTDNKDWDSKPGFFIRGVNSSGTQIGSIYAELYCCSSDRNSDEWRDNTTTPRMTLTIKENLTKEQLSKLHYFVRLQASHRGGGNDKWRYNAHLEVSYSDGTSQYWRFDEGELHSRGQSIEEHHYALR